MGKEIPLGNRQENQDTDDAQHPFRQLAIKIIEQALEPVFGMGIEGEIYYQLEDAIVEVLKSE